MIFKWESQEERLLKFISISAKRKLEWLKQMHDFLCAGLTRKRRYIYHKLRESR
jgi:hypothetical protein